MATVFERIDTENKDHMFYMQIAKPERKTTTLLEVAEYLKKKGCNIQHGNPGFRVMLDPEGNFSEVLTVEVNVGEDTEDGDNIADLVRIKLRDYAEDYHEITDADEFEE